MDECIGNQLANGRIGVEWNFPPDSVINHFVTRKQRIEMVGQGLETCGVAFSDYLLTNRFDPPLAFIDDDTHRFPCKRLEFILVAGKENGSKICDVPFASVVPSNHPVRHEAIKDLISVRR